ncbi:MAG: FmdB family zinc ribbon protein [Pseudonocardia sp.]
MPTYQYACKDCGHRFEAVQSFADASLTECPQCSGGLRKVFSSVGIVFKGSGFYRTDSRSGSSTVGAAGGGSSSDTGPSGSSGTSSDSGGSSSSTSSSGNSSSSSSSPAKAATSTS